jgi:hypothetical protein
MIALLWVGLLPNVLAADWRLVDETVGCKVYVDDSQDTYHGKATCTWTDIPSKKVIEALVDPAHAPEFMTAVLESRVLSRDGNKLTVFQVHAFPVGSDRETYKNLTNVPLDNGLRIEWSLFADPPPPTQGRVTLAVDSGYWEIRKEASGTEIEFFMAYAPGGFLGIFPANKFMAEGMVTTLTQLRAEAGK